MAGKQCLEDAQRMRGSTVLVYLPECQRNALGITAIHEYPDDVSSPREFLISKFALVQKIIYHSKYQICYILCTVNMAAVCNSTSCPSGIWGPVTATLDWCEVCLVVV